MDETIDETSLRFARMRLVWQKMRESLSQRISELNTERIFAEYVEENGVAPISNLSEISEYIRTQLEARFERICADLRIDATFKELEAQRPRNTIESQSIESLGEVKTVLTRQQAFLKKELLEDIKAKLSVAKEENSKLKHTLRQDIKSLASLGSSVFATVIDTQPTADTDDIVSPAEPENSSSSKAEAHQSKKRRRGSNVSFLSPEL